MTTLEQSQQNDLFPMELESMSSLAASPAKTSQSQAINEALRRNDRASGQSAPVLLGKFDLDTPSLKTSQTCLMENGELGLSEYSLTFPRSGMMRNGTVYQLPNLARTTTEIGSGLSLTPKEFWRTPDTGAGGTTKALLRGETHRQSGSAIQIRLADQVKMWPTPTVQDSNKATKRWREDHQNNLTAHVFNPEKRMFPTPTSRDYKGGYKTESLIRRDGKSRAMDALPNAVIDGKGIEKVTGQLNPTWVEWLMGFPLGHTELNA